VNSLHGENAKSNKKCRDDEVEDGENSLVVYPNLESFRQIYTEYVKKHLAKEKDENDDDGKDSSGGFDNNNNTNSEQWKSNSKSRRIILIAPFYETINSVKHHLRVVGVKDIQRLIDDGSLVLVDAFDAYNSDIEGMKKLVASLSERAKKEGRSGVTAIIDMGFFFLFGGDGSATQLIKYESTLPPKTDGGNVKSFSCYHVGSYNTLNESQKKEIIAQGQKKLFEFKE
jgi:hypothetical protein